MRARMFAKRIALSVAGAFLIYLIVEAWLEQVNGPPEGTGPAADILRAYAAYPLDKKMELLLKHGEEERVAPYMLTHVVRHGEAAYRELLPYLKGEKQGLDRDLAGQGMWWMHGWGYDLKNTEAHEILESMLAQSSVRYWLRMAVREIRTEPAGSWRRAMESNDNLILQLLIEEGGR